MKKIKLLSVLFLASMAIISCSKDDDNNGNNAEGSFSFDGTIYDLKSGMVEYWGANATEDAYNFDLVLVTTDVTMTNGEYMPVDNVFSAIYFEMWSESPDDLALGEYTFASDNSAGTISAADLTVNANFAEDTEGAFHIIDNGTVQVLENGGGTYKIIFEGTTMDGTEVSGSYEGTLFTEDVAGKISGTNSTKKSFVFGKK